MHQVAMVFDLNKCMGCQTCAVACKTLWTTEPGEEHQWWCTVNTQPGQGTPKGWERMGGGYRDLKAVRGHQPTREEFGGGWRFNFEEVFYGGKGRAVHLQPQVNGSSPPQWGPNWDEDQGGGEYPNAYFFYLPRLCNHCTRPACVEACPAGAMYKRQQDSHRPLAHGVALHLGNGCGVCRVCRAGHPNCCSKMIAPGLHIDGAFAEAVKVPAGSLVHVPDEVSLTAAAVATDCVGTPYHALKCRAHLQGGERVAVIGVGGVGGHAVRLASLLGAAQVVAVDLSPGALQRAAASGATETVAVQPDEDPGTRIQQLTGGGADVVVECVGNPSTLAYGVRALRPGGRLIAVGVGMMPPQIDLPQALFSLMELSVLGSFGSHKEDLEEIFRLEAVGKIDIESSISHRLALAQVEHGLDMLRTKSGDPQRIVVEM